jgi:small-conductance mechanosensitive channel
MTSAGTESTTPVPRARRTPSTAAHGPQFAYGQPAGFADTVASMTPAVSQVSRSTKTRLRFLRRLVILIVFLVLVAIALSQFTELKRLATGILASTAVLAAIIGFAAQHTIGNMVAGVQLAVSQPIKIGDRISFEEVDGRVTDITLSYTYISPGDGTTVVIPNQMLVDGIIHNLSTEDTQA